VPCVIRKFQCLEESGQDRVEVGQMLFVSSLTCRFFSDEIQQIPDIRSQQLFRFYAVKKLAVFFRASETATIVCRRAFRTLKCSKSGYTKASFRIRMQKYASRTCVSFACQIMSCVFQFVVLPITKTYCPIAVLHLTTLQVTALVLSTEYTAFLSSLLL